MPCHMLFSVFDAEILARFLKRVAFIRECKRQCSQVQEVATKSVVFFFRPCC